MYTLRKNLSLVLFSAPLFFMAPAMNQCQSVQNHDMIRRAMSVQSIGALSISEDAIHAVITVGTPTPCWSHYETRVERDGNEFSVKAIAELDPEVNCIQILGSYETTVKIQSAGPGEYTLHLWQSDTASLDTTFTVQ